jgi:hypothetical protein
LLVLRHFWAYPSDRQRRFPCRRSGCFAVCAAQRYPYCDSDPIAYTHVDSVFNAKRDAHILSYRQSYSHRDSDVNPDSYGYTIAHSHGDARPHTRWRVARGASAYPYVPLSLGTSTGIGCHPT